MSHVNGINMSPFGRKYAFQLEDILIRFMLRVYCIAVYTHMSPVNGMYMQPFGRKYTFQLEDILISML